MPEVFVIAQGGGPTAVINQTVAGAAMELRTRHPGARLLGARHGVRGVRKGDFIDLSTLSDNDIIRLGNTPNAALGSTRDKPDAQYCAEVLDALKKASASAFIYIGGNDTAGTMQILEESGSGMAFVHAPKTIDNDLVESDHTPGFISAGWFVANAFLSIDLDFRAMPGIYVGIVMGRHAGFLTAAAAAWRKSEASGPHLIYAPEHPFVMQRFFDDVAAVREKHGRCTVAMSEGIAGEDGKPVLQTLLGEQKRDAHGNLQLSGGDLGVSMQAALNEAFPKVRSRVDTFGYLLRGFAGMAAETDSREAFEAGAFAVASASSGSCSVALKYENGITRPTRVSLAAVAGKTRHMPSDFTTAAGTELASAGMAYFDRLLPGAPDILPSFLK